MKTIRLIGIVAALLLCVTAIGEGENRLKKKTVKKNQFLLLSCSPDKRSVIGVLRPVTGKAEDATLVVKTATKTFPLVPIGDALSDMRLLFECIAEQELRTSSLCRDFGSSVTWSPDSQWFVIDGGAHKFSARVVYKLQRTGPELHHLPSDDEIATAARKPGNLHRQKLEVPSDEPYVISLGPGVFGLHSHPFTCCDEGDDIHVYIIIDFQGAEVGRIVAIGDIVSKTK